MKTTLDINGHGRKLIEQFEREHGKTLPPLLIGYMHPVTPWTRLTNIIAKYVFQLRLKLWTRKVMKQYKAWLKVQHDKYSPSV